jgi:hypothetical protein
MSVAYTVALLAGRYRLDQPIASGRFGEVWRGTDMCLARPVAVKLLRPDLAADAWALAQFRDSARRTGSVVHEGIARIYDYIESGSSQPSAVGGDGVRRRPVPGRSRGWRASGVRPGDGCGRPSGGCPACRASGWLGARRHQARKCAAQPRPGGEAHQLRNHGRAPPRAARSSSP